MDSVDIGTVTSTGGNKWHGDNKNRDWHKRLHLRKNVVQPPTMQSEDKHGPKKIAEEWEQSTVWPSSKEPPLEAQQSQPRTSDSGTTLRFTCSQCRDNLEYVPKDLVRHFEEKHKGSPPVFSCNMCNFSTHEFSNLQVHLLSHKDTFSSCSICNDSVQRTWPEFSAHLAMYHCQKGKYSCEMCQKFSTSDVGVFLEHMYVHNLGLENASDDLLLHTMDTNNFGSKTTTQTLCCQQCGYEGSQKLLITKHSKVVHVCPNVNQRKKKKNEVHTTAMKSNDPIPKMKPRLTRSAVREMCWLTQDCLSLPGREFLDKYCHLSDPQTTLEETQQFLMKSVAGETGGQKWTKALKTVLSNVPQDINLHPKAENGIMSNSSDLTVLTVKNKITVAQNGATYAKKLKMMTPSEKETVSPESVTEDPCFVVDQNRYQSSLNDHPTCPQSENKLNTDLSLPAQNEPSECAQMQENRENQEVKTDQEIEDHDKKHEHMHEDGINTSSELKLTNEGEEKTFVHQVTPKNKRRNRRRKRMTRSKKADKRLAGLPLKIVLKKNPVKERQWVSQSSLSPSVGSLTYDCHGLPSSHTTLEETVHILPEALLPEAHQKKWTKPSKTDLHNPSEAITSILKPGEVTPSYSATLVGSKNIDTNMPVVFKGLLSEHQGTRDNAEKSLQFLKTEAGMSGSVGRTGQSHSSAAAETELEVCTESVQLQPSATGMGCHMSADEGSSAADRVTPPSSYTESSPVSQPVIIPHGRINPEDVSLALSSEQTFEGIRDREVPADSCLDLLSYTNSPAVKAIQWEPSPAPGHQWQPVPKNRERTLKLVAISPHQLVKRPAGDQPVVVLNHPDADIPEVTRIMEVVNRYRGEVQKVVLSRRTANALSAMNGEISRTNDATDAQLDSTGHGKNSVQERFLLKLKLRRLSRKKYEVVGAVSPSEATATRFRCWFCGRVFASQEMWMVHRQRHLMEWK
uniref:zinc finger protein 518A n=1 Tax=Scatophagus argus TaxID=75038 RepID=UPI001ED8582C|nr:zinc finger protein 518A [Scatophagus argus]XP_046257759.1 zinc finger protein 518A [Scatophagus argus]XP_046257760.1 zinc finger protein 518A [Scatophagus argus]XP_046257761.1 zinc finger protein 518A [Scatophagus argus]